MKLWITTRTLSSDTNRDRTIPSNTLLPKRRNSIQKSKTHLSRRKLWMTTTNPTRKRSLTILHLYLPTYRTRYILWILQLHPYLICRCSNSISNYSNSICRVRTTLGANIILRCNSNYKSPFSNPICRKGGSSMSMRRVRSRQRHTYTILRTPLPIALCYRSHSNNPPPVPTPDRIK